MVNKVERQVIFGKHFREGNDYYSSVIKTNDLVKYQKALKILNHEYQSLLKTNENLLKQIEQLNNKLLNLQRSPSEPEIKITSVKTNPLFIIDINSEELKKCRVFINRIQNNMQKSELYTKDRIKRDFLVHHKVIDFSLNYLLSTNVIESVMKSGKIYYRLREDLI
jgi:predicted RNase H-like nuclease (RuvC/YqgF family)